MNNQILRLPEVLDKTSLSRSSIYVLINTGQFPKQIKLGERSVGWIAEEINDWIDSRIEESRSEGVAL